MVISNIYVNRSLKRTQFKTMCMQEYSDALLNRIATHIFQVGKVQQNYSHEQQCKKRQTEVLYFTSPPASKT